MDADKENTPKPKKQKKKSPSVIKKIWCKLPFGFCKKAGGKSVAVLRLAGIIDSSGGMFKKGLSLLELEDDITKAFEMSGVKAVAVQINSPGGSPVQSELIYNRIRRLSEEKDIPVFTFAEDVAASGGYWLACVGEEIYASNSSIVGSIGVISAGFGFEKTIEKLGVERRVYSQGENKSVLDPFQKEKPEDIRILTSAQKDVHDAFKDLVRERRKGKIKKTAEKQLFSGEFWSGKKALELGLIDGIGDMHDIMKEKYGDKVKFIKVSKPQSWLKRKLGMSVDMLVDSVYHTVAQRSLWSRFGL